MSLDLTAPELKFALEAATAAGALAERVQSGMKVEGITKRDLSPVTVGDYALQAVVGRALGEAFPGAVLVAEEDAHDLRTPDGAGTLELVTDFVKGAAPEASADAVCDWIDHGNGDPGDRFWVLDPIDGTKGFLRQEQYAVALALVENGEVKLGVLACPNLSSDCTPNGDNAGVLVAAVRGQGAWCRSMSNGGEFRALKVSPCDDMRHARMLRSVESGHTNVGQIGELVNLLGVEADPVSLDSQAKYAVLGSGGGELLFRLLSPGKLDYREKIWDQAAGAIVVEEAGGRISDLAGNPLDFSQGSTLARNSGVCASNGLLHDGALEALSKLGTPE